MPEYGGEIPKRGWIRPPYFALKRGISMPHSPSGRKHEFAAANFHSQKPRKTWGFSGPKKTLNFFQKTACIENPLLVSYSPVAPLKANAESGSNKLIFEK
jgi:hypothetical protein